MRNWVAGRQTIMLDVLVANLEKRIMQTIVDLMWSEKEWLIRLPRIFSESCTNRVLKSVS